MVADSHYEVAIDAGLNDIDLVVIAAHQLLLRDGRLSGARLTISEMARSDVL
jgi:hypothetical protein